MIQKIMMTSLIGLLLITFNVHAERYLVVFKNKQTFQQADMQLSMTTLPLSSIRIRSAGQVQSPFAKASDIEVEASLQNLQTLVVNSNDARSVEALKASGAVAFVEKEIFHPAPKPILGFKATKPWSYQLSNSGFSAYGSVGPKTPWGIRTVRAPEAWNAAHYGAGSRVVVLDTGIDRDHPALKANYESGRDFTNSGEASLPYPEMDEQGHGTHVAGTIAGAFGADGFVGVAPHAKILMGKVCSEQGCSNVAITNGVNWAISEKADVVSMSLGGRFATLAERLAIESAEKAGVVVVAASGNDGEGPNLNDPDPLKRRSSGVSYPAALPTVIAVGATNDKNVKTDFSNWGPELDIVAPGAAVVSSVPQGTGRESKVQVGAAGNEVQVPSTGFSGSPESLTPVSSELVASGLGKPEDFDSAKVTGKFALIKRGEITFADKVANAVKAGATGVIIYNNTSGLLQGALTQDGSTVAVPVVMIEQVTGEKIRGQLDLGATIRAVIQTIPTDYSAFDGTSMATPHVSGVVALMKAAKRSATPAQIREALKLSAVPLSPNDENQNGAGLVNAEAAVELIKK